MQYYTFSNKYQKQKIKNILSSVSFWKLSQVLKLQKFKDVIVTKIKF